MKVLAFYISLRSCNSYLVIPYVGLAAISRTNYRANFINIGRRMYLWKEWVGRRWRLLTRRQEFSAFLNFLDELGYVAAPWQADRILYDAARRAIERFGQSARLVEFHFIKNGLSKGQDVAYTFSKDT